MKKNYKSSIDVAITGLLPLASQFAQAEVNPFALSELNSAYLQTAEAKPADDASKMKDGACGEGKCGAAMMKPAPATDKKALEGKCAGNKPAAPATGSEKK